MSYINSKTLNTIYLPERLLPSDTKRISEPDEFGRGVKFVRADVLLEWAKKRQCEQGFEDGEAEHGYQSAIQDLIKHIESL